MIRAICRAWLKFLARAAECKIVIKMKMEREWLVPAGNTSLLQFLPRGLKNLALTRKEYASLFCLPLSTGWVKGQVKGGEGLNRGVLFRFDRKALYFILFLYLGPSFQRLDSSTPSPPYHKRGFSRRLANSPLLRTRSCDPHPKTPQHPLFDERSLCELFNSFATMLLSFQGIVLTCLTDGAPARRPEHQRIWPRMAMQTFTEKHPSLQRKHPPSLRFVMVSSLYLSSTSPTSSGAVKWTCKN